MFSAAFRSKSEIVLPSAIGMPSPSNGSRTAVPSTPADQVQLYGSLSPDWYGTCMVLAA